MRHLLHKAICRYLRCCAGAFHCYSYGPKGRYVVLMNDRQYHRYTALASDEKVGQQIMGYRNLMRSIDADVQNAND